MMGGYLNWSYWCLRDIWRAIKCNYSVHNYMDWSAMACGNVAQMNILDKFAYTYRICWHCGGEMPHSRYFMQIGVREKNAKEYAGKYYYPNIQ